MAETQVQKNLREQINKLKVETNNSHFSQFIHSLEGILEKVEPQYDLDAHGNYPVMSEAEYRDLLGAYQNAIVQGATSRRAIEGEETNEAQLHILENITSLLSKDFNVLTDLNPQAPGVLATAISNARTRTVEVHDKELAHVGEKMSSRIPISFRDENGVERSGFFTQAVALSEENDKKAVLDKHCKEHPKYEKYFRKITETESFQEEWSSESYINYARQLAIDNNEYHLMWNSILSEVGISQKEISALATDDSFSDAACNYALDIHSIHSKHATLRQLGIESPESLDKRNSAMSTVASLLGVPNLLAKSVSMNVVIDGQTLTGTFMENATGIDLIHAPSDSPLFQCNVNSVEKSTLFKDVADMQVLDYLCGNEDRHNANYFYKVDTSNPLQPKLTGIMGIDNDLSFVKFDDAVSRMVAPDKMHVVSESMANVVKNLNEAVLKTALIDYNFSKDELSAVAKRLQNLKDTIALGEAQQGNNEVNVQAIDPSKNDFIRIIPDNTFGKLDFLGPELAIGKDVNMFKSLHAVLETMSAFKEKAVDRETLAAQKQADELAAKKPTFNQATELNPTGMRAFHLNGEKLSKLLSDLEKSDRAVMRRSKEFVEMKKSLQALQTANNAMPDVPSQQQLTHLTECYDAVQQMSAAYLKYKEGARDTSLMRRRVGIAKEIHSFASDNAERLHDIQQEQQQKSISNDLSSLERSRIKLQEFEKDNERYLEQIRTHAPDSAIYKIGQTAHLAHSQLCVLAAQETLSPQEQTKVRKNVATMLAYEKVSGERHMSKGQAGPLETILGNENRLTSFVNQLMQSKSFQKLTSDITPQFAESIVKDNGIKALNKQHDEIQRSKPVAQKSIPTKANENHPQVKRSRAKQGTMQ